MVYRSLACLAMALLSISSGAASSPRVSDDRFRLELVAREPAIVTPIGMAFDREGRLLVLESHTHDRPAGYRGPKDDRIVRFSDSNGDGRLDHSTTFAKGIRDAMNLLVRPDGAVYVVTGKRVLLLQDTTSDGVADHQQVLLRLETEAPNPHNSLNGIAREPLSGALLVGLGQTRTFPYRLIDAQGNELSGTDGAGAIFRISESGGGLKQIATGFWNPFSICILPDGRIFAVDNDPDDRPPCRLLHIVRGGDYGYRYQYTRGGTHPLQAWDGELPGTLPMVCGTGEAPTAVVPHAGRLWVTSWGDHRIERYRLVPRGASYEAEREVIVQGNHDFRPTGMAVAPDGSLYFGDWMLRDYPVHGRGRIWRLVLTDEELQTTFPPPNGEDHSPTSLDVGSGLAAANSADPFKRAHAIERFSQDEDSGGFAKEVAENPLSARQRLAILQAHRLRGTDHAELILRQAVQDESADVRLFAVRWIADERIAAMRDDVADLLNRPQPSSRYYLAVLAAIDWLEHEQGLRGRGFNEELLVRELENQGRSLELHTLALGLLSPDHGYLSLVRLQNYLKHDHLPLRLEAARALAQQSGPDRYEVLAAVARDTAQHPDVRAEAIIGLSADAVKYGDLLQEFADASDSQLLRREAQRALRLAGMAPTQAESRPPAADLRAWYALLNGAGDAQAGRRLFFSPVGPRCSVCHQYSGRGGSVGPDLTHIGTGTSRERIIASILQPSREIAPDYQPWLLVTDDGKSHLGLRSAKPVGQGVEQYVDSAGTPFSLQSRDIESRQASAVSIMPDDVTQVLSVADLRDLVSFLMAPAE